MVRLPDAELQRLDTWIEAQPDPKPSRPEALRRLADQGLAGNVWDPKTGDQKYTVEDDGRVRDAKGDVVGKLVNGAIIGPDDEVIDYIKPLR